MRTERTSAPAVLGLVLEHFWLRMPERVRPSAERIARILVVQPGFWTLVLDGLTEPTTREFEAIAACVAVGPSDLIVLAASIGAVAEANGIEIVEHPIADGLTRTELRERLRAIGLPLFR